MAQISFATTIGYRKAGNIALMIERKSPTLILDTFMYKPNYLVIEDKLRDTDGPIQYLYYPIKVDITGPRIRFTKYPSLIAGGFVILSGNKVFDVSCNDIMRGVIKHNSLICSGPTQIKSFMDALNERNGTVAVVVERSAEEDYERQASENVNIPNLAEIDVLQYTSNPQAFWAI